MAEVYKDIHQDAIDTLHQGKRKPLSEEGFVKENQVKLSTYSL